MRATGQPQEDDGLIWPPLPAEPARTAPPSAGRWWRLALIGTIALLLALGLLEVLEVIARPLALLVAAIVLAEALAPLVDWLARRLNRTLAIVLVYLLLLLVVALIAWLVVPRLTDQARQLIAAMPQLVEQARSWIERRDLSQDSRLMGALQGFVTRLTDRLMSIPLTLASYLVEATLVVFMSAYWLAAQPEIARFFLSLFSRERRQSARAVLAEMGETMGGYVRGVVIDAAIIGVLVYLGLMVIGVQYTLVLALIAGVSEVIPIVGPILGAIPAIAVALLDSPSKALIVLGFFVAVQQVESNLLTPFIMRSQTDIPPILTLFAILVGGAIGGIFWILIAIPTMGALRVLALRVVAPAVRHWSGAATAPVDGTRQERA